MASLLRRTFGAPEAPPETDPFGLIVWESAAYLVDDARRLRVFDRLRAAIGIDADAIASTLPVTLANVIREDGGMMPKLRAEKLQRAATLALEIGPARLHRIAREPEPTARRLLRRFPGVGEPGVDKLLMFAGGLKTLAPDSNALRVLQRLGFATAEGSYTRQYREVAEAVAPQLLDDKRWLIQTHLMLRRHGQTICRRTAPHCPECPLTPHCAFFNSKVAPKTAPKGR